MNPPRNHPGRKRPQQKPDVICDDKSQIKRIEPYLVRGEKLQGVLDCKDAFTGFVGFTDKRVIFHDQAVILQHKNMMSIPYKRITAVAASDDGFVFKISQITIVTAAGQYSFEFASEDKAKWAYNYLMERLLNA